MTPISYPTQEEKLPVIGSRKENTEIVLTITYILLRHLL